MARVFLSILLLVGLAACEGGAPDDKDAALHGKVQALSASLEDTRAQAARLKRRLERERRRAGELRGDLRRTRGVDLWTGGPTVRGTFLALPRLGSWRWTCDDDYGFRIVFEPGGASVHATYDSPDLSSARIVHPGQSLGATVAAGESVAWTITHRHKPGFVRAHVDVTTARSKHGNCLLPAVRVEERGRLYD